MFHEQQAAAVAAWHRLHQAGTTAAADQPVNVQAGDLQALLNYVGPPPSVQELEAETLQDPAAEISGSKPLPGDRLETTETPSDPPASTDTTETTTPPAETTANEAQS